MPSAFEQYVCALSEKGISVVYNPQATTAYYNLSNRTVTMPTFEWFDESVKQHLLSHESSHVLHSDYSIKEFKELMKEYGDVFNIVEDCRIEKLIKLAYPGLNQIFKDSFKVLAENDFFGCDIENNIQKGSFLDRLNIFFKSSGMVKISFSPEESKFVFDINACNTKEDCIKLTKELFEYIKEHQESTSASMDFEDLLNGMDGEFDSAEVEKDENSSRGKDLPRMMILDKEEEEKSNENNNGNGKSNDQEEEEDSNENDNGNGKSNDQEEEEERNENNNGNGKSNVKDDNTESKTESKLSENKNDDGNIGDLKDHSNGFVNNKPDPLKSSTQKRFNDKMNEYGSNQNKMDVFKIFPEFSSKDIREKNCQNVSYMMKAIEDIYVNYRKRLTPCPLKNCDKLIEKVKIASKVMTSVFKRKAEANNIKMTKYMEVSLSTII